MFINHEKGIRLAESELFIDAHRVVPFSFISHGHSDHLKNHKKILATPPTLRFFQSRFEKRVRKPELLPLPFFEPFQLDDYTITLFPAGHILGSAMILVEKHGTRLLYTGDFKLQPGLTAEPIQIPRADILIMETTYGHPDYCFNQEERDVGADLNHLIKQIRSDGYLPVVLAYSLGKAQEVMALLGELGYSMAVHSTIWKLAKIYEEFGIRFRNVYEFTPQSLGKSDVLIVPPHVFMYQTGPNLPAFRSIFLSGWAENGSHGPNIPCDYSIPWSDHADFEELVQFVEKVSPTNVYTLHGFPGFTRILQDLGYKAEWLGK